MRLHKNFEIKIEFFYAIGSQNLIHSFIKHSSYRKNKVNPKFEKLFYWISKCKSEMRS